MTNIPFSPSIPLSLFKIGFLGSLDFRLVLFSYYTLESLWFWDLSMEHIGRGFWSKVSHWTYRWLSLVGRVILLKTVVQSLPIYRCCVQVPPSTFLRDFDALSR